MKLFSCYDLRPGDDGRPFVATDSPLGDDLKDFRRIDVKFHGREEVTEPCTGGDQEIALVIMQGRGRIVVDDVEHPVSAFDVMIVQPGETWSVRCDGVDPPVVLTFETGSRSGV